MSESTEAARRVLLLESLGQHVSLADIFGELGDRLTRSDIGALEALDLLNKGRNEAQEITDKYNQSTNS